jgi:hypothetical protein
MSRKSKAVPPIRVGSKAVTYTPPGPSGVKKYERLVFHCEILALRLDGVPVDAIYDNVRYDRRDVRADLRLPDGTEVKDAPYCDQVAWTPGDGSEWCRPFITSMKIH